MADKADPVVVTFIIARNSRCTTIHYYRNNPYEVFVDDLPGRNHATLGANV